MYVKDLLSDFKRIHLCHQPTPLEEMPRLTAALGGPRLWIKAMTVRACWQQNTQAGIPYGGGAGCQCDMVVTQSGAVQPCPPDCAPLLDEMPCRSGKARARCCIQL